MRFREHRSPGPHQVRLVWPAQEHGVLFGELRDRVLDECDYVLEATHIGEFARIVQGREDLVFPRVLPSLPAPARILTIPYVIGDRLEAFVAHSSPADRNHAGAALWHFYFESVFRHDLLHADPHPDNLLFRPDRVAWLLDFGRVKRLSPAFKETYKHMVRALMERDFEAFRREVIAIGCVPDPTHFDFHYAYRAMTRICAPYLWLGRPLHIHVRVCPRSVGAGFIAQPQCGANELPAGPRPARTAVPRRGLATRATGSTSAV